MTTTGSPRAVAIDRVPPAAILTMAAERADLPLALATRLNDDLVAAGLETVYRDLDISILDELPSGGQQIRTEVRTADALPKVWPWLKERIALGEQAFIVTPRIEEDAEGGDLPSAEATYRDLTKKELAGLRLALAVQVDAGVGLVGQLRPAVHFFAQEVQHLDAGMRRGGAQRPAGHGADVLFELIH